MTRLLIGPVLRHIGATDATIFVETDEPCEVEILGRRERTWTAWGHHYALVVISDLEPGTSTEYQVALDGEQAWPTLDAHRPPSRIRTLGGAGPVRLAFGSCRYGRAANKLGDKHFDPDALACYARELTTADDADWPTALIMLGDQVYADETSVATQRRIRAKRTPGPDNANLEVADFEEYTWLYLESWTDPDVRWLMSTVPSAMIFDDHDVRDDWNTSHLWRDEMRRTSWWHDRIVGGLASYWVYQHLGNLAPAELATNELFLQVRGHGRDVRDLLTPFAEHADAEADGAKGTRWSYRQDFGGVRLVMIDSRCGRILADRSRSMVSEDEFAWIEKQFDDGPCDHLLVGTSLPWLLARALHDLEAWDEAMCDEPDGTWRARFGEWLRRAADLEHWASFRRSFERLGALLGAVARRADAPASICVLSGDVHHAYLAEAELPGGGTAFQLTCSPLHNYVPAAMNLAFRVFWSRVTERIVRIVLGVVHAVPLPAFSWTPRRGPYFGNMLATFTATGRESRVTIRKTVQDDAGSHLAALADLDLSRG